MCVASAGVIFQHILVFETQVFLVLPKHSACARKMNLVCSNRRACRFANRGHMRWQALYLTHNCKHSCPVVWQRQILAETPWQNWKRWHHFPCFLHDPLGRLQMKAACSSQLRTRRVYWSCKRCHRVRATLHTSCRALFWKRVALHSYIPLGAWRPSHLVCSRLYTSKFAHDANSGTGCMSPWTKFMRTRASAWNANEPI